MKQPEQRNKKKPTAQSKAPSKPTGRSAEPKRAPSTAPKKATSKAKSPVPATRKKDASPSAKTAVGSKAAAKPAKKASRAVSRSTPPSKPRNADVRPREFLTADEIEKLKAAALSNERHGFRDWLLISMMYRHALRVTETATLRWTQINFARKIMFVERMKNGEASEHYLEADEIKALKQLKDEQDESEYVFNSQRRNMLSSRSLHWIVARAGQDAGLKFTVHPHMLRHSKGFQLAERGADTRAIQMYLGHKNIQHTAMYKRIDPKVLKGFGRD